MPIVGSDDFFVWGVWAGVHEKDFDTIHEFWNKAGRESLIGPFRGRLANSLLTHPDTLNLLLQIKIRPIGERPLFLLEESEHPLAMEQHSGLIVDKAKEYGCMLLSESESDI